MKKVFYLFGLIVATLVLSACNNNKTKWIGQVSPGSYYGIYDFHMDWNTAHVTLQLTIEKDGKVDLRETWQGGGCAEGTRAYEGYIILQEEVYNGETKRWYTLSGYNTGIEVNAHYSISENLEVKRGVLTTYQEFSTAKVCCKLQKQ